MAEPASTLLSHRLPEARNIYIKGPGITAEIASLLPEHLSHGAPTVFIPE